MTFSRIISPMFPNVPALKFRVALQSYPCRSEICDCFQNARHQQYLYFDLHEQSERRIFDSYLGCAFWPLRRNLLVLLLQYRPNSMSQLQLLPQTSGRWFLLPMPHRLQISSRFLLLLPKVPDSVPKLLSGPRNLLLPLDQRYN